MSLKKGVQRFLGCFWVREFFTNFQGFLDLELKNLAGLGDYLGFAVIFVGRHLELFNPRINDDAFLVLLYTCTGAPKANKFQFYFVNIFR